MTTQTGDSQAVNSVSYEGQAPSFGGFDSADFAIDRPNQHILEVNLRLSLDARALFEAALSDAEAANGLDDRGVQRLLQALGQRQYSSPPPDQEIPAIITLRARDIDPASIGDLLAEADLL